jgi:hypothetical protein
MNAAYPRIEYEESYAEENSGSHERIADRGNDNESVLAVISRVEASQNIHYYLRIYVIT